MNEAAVRTMSGGTEVVASVDVSAAEVCRCSDRVIEVRIRPGATVGVREMEAILAAQISLMIGPAVVMVDARPVKSMTRQAQELVTGTASERDTRAVAIVIESPVSTLLGNFFLALARPVYPTKLFRRPAEARRWLLAHLQ